MKGKITSYLPDKAYGSIAGDDGHDYYFHEKSFSIAEHRQEITDGLSVQFDALPTPEGYRAESIKFEIEPVDLKFEVPANVMMSKSNDVRGWQIVENGSWLISVESRDTIDDAKEQLCNRASILGANAILNCNFQEKIGSDPGTGNGTPIYTINRLTGRVANIGKRSVVGEYQLSDLTKLDVGIRAFLETKKKMQRRIASVAFLASLVTLVIMSQTLVWPVLISVIVFIVVYWSMRCDWIERVD